MELRATAFFSRLIPAVSSDSAIGSIIHLPLKSASSELPARGLLLTTVSRNVVHFWYPSTCSALGRYLLWRNTTTCHALLFSFLRFRMLLAMPPMARIRVRTNPLRHPRRRLRRVRSEE